MPLTTSQVHDIGDALLHRWAREATLSIELLERSEHGSVFACRHEPFAVSGASHLDDVDGWATDVRIGRLHVLSVRAEDPDARLPLRLWWRMARDPLPWFILRIEIDEDGAPVRAVLTHVELSLIFFVYGVRHAFGAAGEGGTNQDAMLDVTPRAQDALVPLEAATLRARIAAAVPDLRSYAHDKARGLRWADVSGARHQVVLARGPRALSPAEREGIVDFAIGLRPTLPTDAFLADTEDLDVIYSAGEPRTPRDLELPWPPSLGRVTLVVSTEEGDVHESLECDVHSPVALVEGLAREDIRRRYVSALVSIVTSPRAPHATLVWKVPLPDQVALADLAAAARVTSIFAGARAPRRAWIMRSVNQVESLIAIRSQPQIFADDIREMADACRDAAQLAARFGLRLDTMVDPRQLHVGRSSLRALARLLDPRTPAEIVTVLVERQLVPSRRPATIVIPLALRLGETMLTAVVAYTQVGDVSAEPNRHLLTVRGGETRILDTSAEPAATWSPDRFHARARDAAARIAAEDRSGIVVFAPDEPRAAEVIRG